MPTVLTHLLTTTIDPQRGTKWPPDPTPFLPLVTTAQHHGAEVVILHDEPLIAPTPAHTEIVGTWSEDVYWRRWHHTLAWLMNHPEADTVFAVDGSDVTMLRRPWAEIEPGFIYVGSETAPLANRWMLKGHPHPALQSFMRDHARGTLYNAGIVGGARQAVLEFVTDMLDVYGELTKSGNVGSDMGLLNLVAHTRWTGKVITGPRVHTTFKTYADNGVAWWMHK